MTVIRYTWLNIKRNRLNHLKISSLNLLILLIIFSMLQVYRMTSFYISEYRHQASMVIKGVEDLNQTNQIDNFKTTDYEKLKSLSYVKKSQMTGGGIVASTLDLPVDNKYTISVSDYSSRPSNPQKESYLSVKLLDNDSLMRALSKKDEKFQGEFPVRKNTCVISRALAKTNNLNLNDNIILGAKQNEQKIKIVGIAQFTTNELNDSSAVLFNWRTGDNLQNTIMQTFSSVTFQLTSKKEIKTFLKEFKKAKSFKNYSLISQNWLHEIFQSVGDTNDLLLNCLIVALILGFVLISVGYQQILKRRQDFYTLYLSGMNHKNLILSGSLENIVLTIWVSYIGFLGSQQLSRWITGEWLSKLRKNLMMQEPFVEWTLPQLSQESNGLNYTEIAFLVVCQLIVLLLLILQISRIVYAPIQEDQKDD
ncbi:hypothetical protein [Enterococcus sp. AZ007]|uniref:hypothetical protein n=1 Tax=Enterococcus sp. AZ007 TaxID=2774839 RepID=UPI003F259DFE